MWPTIDRARRRLSGTGTSAPDEAADLVIAISASSSTDTPVASRRVEDVVIVLGSAEVDRVRAALELALGDAVERPDTPARIERALSVFLGRRGVPGRARVLRRPAGVSTPESWEIHLDGTDRATGKAVREASRTGAFAT